MNLIACDCSCNGGRLPCPPRCGHNGCGWILLLAERQAEECRRIDSGATRSHKPPERRDSPGEADRKSRGDLHRRVRLLTDRLVGSQTFTLEEWRREEQR